MNNTRRNFLSTIAISPLGFLLPKSLQAETKKQEPVKDSDRDLKWEFGDKPWTIHLPYTERKSKNPIYRVQQVQDILSIITTIEHYKDYKGYKKERTNQTVYKIFFGGTITEKNKIKMYSHGNICRVPENELFNTEQEAVNWLLRTRIRNYTGKERLVVNIVNGKGKLDSHGFIFEEKD